MKAVSVSDYRLLARRRVPRFLFEYLDGGAFEEVTMNRNREDLAAIALRQRVLRDVSQKETVIVDRETVACKAVAVPDHADAVLNAPW